MVICVLWRISWATKITYKQINNKKEIKYIEGKIQRKIQLFKNDIKNNLNDWTYCYILFPGSQSKQVITSYIIVIPFFLEEGAGGIPA